MTHAVMLYVTVPTKDEAAQLAAGLLEAGLIACANLLPGMRALYRWEGVLCDEKESVLLLKTQASLADKAIAWVVSHHRYDCPCVVQLPITGGHSDYLTWIADQTSTSSSGYDKP